MSGNAKGHVMKLPKCQWLVWFHGWLNGRMGAAGADETGMVQSGYIQQLYNQYAAYSAKEMALINSQMHEYAAEAEQLLLNITTNMESAPLIVRLSKTEEMPLIERQMEITAIENNKEILKSLIALEHRIRKTEETYQASMLETAKRLAAIFSVYAKGVLWRQPVTADSIPVVDANTQAYQLYQSWDGLKGLLSHIQEVFKIEETK